MSKKASKKSAKKAIKAVSNQEVMAPLPEQFNSEGFGRTILLNALETKTSTIAQFDLFHWEMQKQYVSTPFQF